MVYAIVKEGGRSKVKSVDSIASANVENPKLILGGVQRTPEEKAEMKKEMAAQEKKRVADLADIKKKADVKSKEGLTPAEKKDLEQSEVLKAENADLKNRLASTTTEKSEKEKLKDAEIDKLKKENAELAKNAQGTSSGKPARVKK